MKQQRIQVDDKQFRLYISHEEIAEIIAQLADRLHDDYATLRDSMGRPPLLLPILNGSYMFAADLSRRLHFETEICFVKMASYQGTQSSGTIHSLIGFPDEVAGRDILLIEDLIDTGISMGQVLQQLQSLHVNSVRICSLFLKPGKFQGNFPIHYVGRNIGDDFIVGYGMDYNGLGRCYADLYVLDE